jgi:protein tyrosine phosphatase (PTP) superfamily phosphohydrolase (DUF442 family)
MHRILSLLALAALPFLTVACGGGELGANSVPTLTGFTTAFDAAERVKLEENEPEDFDDVHNVFHLSPNIISGSEPVGREGLERIAAMGVQTILSVDGKVPDAETADELGMRYVHVPIQYRGITDEEMTRIAKTFRELEGPFYVHCFHGKHRGPAAAAVGRVVVDGAPRERALAEMRQWCGTSEKYEGLYRSLASDPIPSATATERYEWDFPAAHRIEGFRHAMIEIPRSFDPLKYLSKRDWKPDPEHPDIDPLNEARKLAEIFEVSNGLEEIQARPADFRQWMDGSVRESVTLREALARLAEGDDSARGEVDRAFGAVSNLCSRCHDSYRND